MTQHNIDPVYDENSKILVLGSFPSVRSREQGFFYGNPYNRFWRVLAIVFGEAVPSCTEEKRELLLRNHIALWDVIASCDVEGSSDSSIKNVIPNDLSLILDNCDVRAIFLNGKTAEKYYNKYAESNSNIKCITLPSTSPANASRSLECLASEWMVLKSYV